MKIISDIANYILYLKKHCHLFISIHPSPERESILSTSSLMAFNFHENSYCALIKRSAPANKHCVDCQKKVLSACAHGPFNGVCFAGVHERVYPITDGSTITGFISVSGYKTTAPGSYFEKLTKNYGFEPTMLSAAYHTLESQIPTDAELDTLLMPLCYMLESAYKITSCVAQPTSFAQQVVQYVNRSRNQNITSEDICKHFSCSRSYMSTQFNKFAGKTLRQYLNELRIHDAKILLKNTDLSVTEIAFSVGFNNSNYFSDLFKKEVGKSPLQFRKESRLP